MADVIRKATNRFTKGLVMDFSPENTKNEVLTQALNATLLTFNGNELSLQNDMGNARVETAYLPEGYMPVGTCEFGGIIYIVSYNPLEDKSQIGCFPSPERTVSRDELGEAIRKLESSYFQELDKDSGKITGNILHNTQYVLLKNDNLNPGDKFMICSNSEIYGEKIENIQYKDEGKSEYTLVSDPILSLNVVSIEDSGRIVYLNSDIKTYEVPLSKEVNGKEYNATYKYHILGKMPRSGDTYEQAAIDLDEYRNTLSSGFSVFKSKTSGKLAILAELIMVDSYSVTHSVKPRVDRNGEIIEGNFDIIIHTEVTPEITTFNFTQVPKLQYHYLKDSEGYIQTGDSKIPLFEGLQKEGIYNKTFLETKLSDIYEPTVEDLELDTQLGKAGQFNFPKKDTYHGRLVEAQTGIIESYELAYYSKFTEGKYHRFDYAQIENNLDYFIETLQTKFYYYDNEGVIYNEYKGNTIDESYTYYVKILEYEYIEIDRDEIYEQSVPLYKVISNAEVATEQEIQDGSIEKFQYQEVQSFIQATKEDIEAGKTIYELEGINTYKQYLGTPNSEDTYYISKTERNLISIGFKPLENGYKGTMYYYPGSKNYEVASNEEREMFYDLITYPNAAPITLYRRKEIEHWEPATKNQLEHFKELGITLYYSTKYVRIPSEEIPNFKESDRQLFMVMPIDTYVVDGKFKPDPTINYIKGYDKPEGEYENDDPIILYTVSGIIPEQNDSTSNNYLKYGDIKLANIQIPYTVSKNGLDLPFKYDYTLVPCMSYGKLDHLAVSNTVDFSKLHAFNQSDFTTWKYRIDNGQLRLTFGADIYDTYEEYKVDGLILEFYDCWGFAGSIEITDKKSYSGIFTKIIPLDSLGALSKKKILNYSQHTNFVRNINIVQDGEQYKYNEAKIEYSDYSGWYEVKDIEGEEKKEPLKDNDCGTLYSNILYGVKTYLRKTTNSGYEFIPKRDFFVFTLPIYNDYYYTVQDFNNLKNPQLDFMLTYKMVDNGTKTVYNETEVIENGFDKADKDTFKNYLSGTYGDTQLSLTKYYQYSGNTDLYLEVGLLPLYEQFNISYSKNINEHFNCNLKLLSDDKAGATFTVNSGVEGIVDPATILNHKNKTTFENYLTFKTDDTGEHKDTKSISNIQGSNFIHTIGTRPIKIHYKFIVGYNADIIKISKTQVPATTICALCHTTPTKEWNYEDLGVYINDKGTFLSSAMFYNEGDTYNESFGLCRQISTDGNMSEQCQSFTNIEQEARAIRTAGKLNTGNPLKHVVPSIGKLTFCQPHAHGLSQTNRVNIHEGDGAEKYYGIPPEVIYNENVGDSEDDTYGAAPRDYLFDHPKYNLSLNTKNSIEYNGEFVSTLEWNILKGKKVWLVNVNNSEFQQKWVSDIDMREYTGFTGEEVARFNKNMINTMKSVYAYNPDYDYLTVNIGEVSLQKYNPSFTSNLLNTSSDFGNINLNDFIYFGSMTFSNYLKNLKDHSGEVKKINTGEGETIIKQLQLTPGFDYCGTPENYYLISPLTYNTPVPQELAQELEYSTSNIIVIKHANGENDYLEGTPNKKALYGYNSTYKKMVQLDVSNYTIGNDGTLLLNDNITKGTKTYEYSLEKDDLIKMLGDSGCDIQYEFEESTVTLNIKLNISQHDHIEEGSNNDAIIAMAGSPQKNGYTYGFYITPKITVTGGDTYSYNVNVKKMTFSGSAKRLKGLWWNSLNAPLEKQKFEVLKALTLSEKTPILLEYTQHNQGELIENQYNTDYQVNNNDRASIWLANIEEQQQTVSVGNDGDYKMRIVNTSGTTSDYIPSIELYYLQIQDITIDITQVSSLEKDPLSFIPVTRTENYWTLKDHKYVINDDYKEARLRGSSITLNDLIYEPNPNGHRLFIRDGLYSYDNYLRGKLYYRLGNFKEALEAWDIKRDSPRKYQNVLFFYTGPCFTLDNLPVI